MKTQTLGKSVLVSSRLSYGCMRITGAWNPSEVTPEKRAAGRKAVITAYESGYTLFDHADIYGQGECERLFGEVLREVPDMRKNILIADKCGIRVPGNPNPDSPHSWDFSADYIIWSCEESLKRLGVETIDIYQLHRPDYLCDPEEVAGAFTQLKKQGKVREFGVSNFLPSLVTAVQKACPMPLIVNQVEISLAHLNCFHDGTLDQCLAEQITPLSWSPLAGGFLGDGGKPGEKDSRRLKLQALCDLLDQTAVKYGVSRTVLCLAWLLKHPSHTIPVVGTTKPERIQDAVKADSLELSREDWYRLMVAARGEGLP